MASLSNPVRLVKQKFESAVYGVIQKYGYPPFGDRGRHSIEVEDPPYAREVSPHWLRDTSHNNALINNSIEEKVNQTFRRGFTEWEKKWEAKCPNCDEEFTSLEPFKLSDDLDDEDVDIEHPRPCPECDVMVEMETPDAESRERAEEMFRQANMKKESEDLVPDEQVSVGQSLLQVCKEVAWDIQTFDDGWMIFERSYSIDSEGSVVDWDLQEIYRAPPFLMRYSVGEDGRVGGEFWACLECRARNPKDYSPDKEPGPCSECGNRTYEVFVKMLDTVNGDPVRYFVRGEFAHGSEYRPRFLYGYSPILSVWQEARTLEQMDEWYQEAYEQRRAPRGALVVRSSNAESVRAWNTEQMQKLNGDANHIPTMIDDTEGSGSPIEWVPLLEDPAAMQHMQMREWFLDRISAKFGVTAVFQNASAESTGLSQSMEIIVSNRSAQRLKGVYEDVFLPAILGQLQVQGWTRSVARIEEEDEAAEAQRIGRELQNAQAALQVGANVEWTRDDKADIRPGELAMDEGGEQEGAGGLGALGSMMGGDTEGEPDAGGQTSAAGGRPEEAEETGGAANEPDTPTTDNPFKRHQEKDTLTSGTSGYSNASYSGETGDAIDYLAHVRRQIEGEEADEADGELVEAAKDAWREVSFGPSVEKLEEIADNPNKNWRSLRRMDDGDWVQDIDKCYAVEQMYRLLDADDE